MFRCCASFTLVALLAGCSTNPPPPLHATARVASAAEPVPAAAAPADPKTSKAAAPKAEAGKSTKTPRGHALLVACTKYDNLHSRNYLKGPANDVVLFRNLLVEQFKFDAALIVTLAEGQGGPTTRPTKANIKREFESLVKKAKAGDQVVILIAGHGFYLKNDKPSEEDPEPDGYDEVFLPCDVQRYSSGSKSIQNCILDDEFRDWLTNIRQTGASVWITLDACHSGTMVRGNEEGEVVRQLQPDDLGVPESESGPGATAEAIRGSSGPSDEADGLVGKGKGEKLGMLVAIYAAQSSEPTVEMPLPREAVAAQQRPYGILTYTINQILRRATSRLSYGELIQRVQQQYTAWGRAFPTPLAEGDGLKVAVMGTAVWPERLDWVLGEKQGEGYPVKAGTLHGLSQNCILSVKPPFGMGDEVLGYVCVKECGPLDCRVEPCEYQGKAAASELPKDARVDVAWIDFASLQPLKIAEQRLVKDPATRSKLQEQWLLAGIPQGMVKVVTDPATADWVVRTTEGEAYLVPASGWAKVRGDSESARSVGTPGREYGPYSLEQDGQRQIATRLRQITKAKNLLSLAEPTDAGRNAAPGVNVQLEFRKHKNKEDFEGAPLGIEQGQPAPAVQKGEMIGIRIVNRGSEDAYVTLLYVDAAYQITPWYPTKNNLPDRLKPEGVLKAPAVPRATINDSTTGLEHFVVVAVPATGQPRTFRWLADETIEKAVATRGDMMRSPLDKLLDFASFGEGDTRGATAEDGAAYCIRTISWKVPVSTQK